MRAPSAGSSGTRPATSTCTPIGARVSRRRPSSSSPTATSAPASTSRCSPRSVARPKSASRRTSPARSASISRPSARTRQTRSSSTPRPAGARHTRTPAGPGAAASKRSGKARWVAGSPRTRHTPICSSARFADDTTTGTPPLLVPAGSRLPAVPAAARMPSSRGRARDWAGFSVALEAQYVDKLYVNDRNTDAAPAYTVANVRVGFEQRVGPWTLREFARVNNLADRNYVGSVIVGDTNGRFFEPAPGAIIWSARARMSGSDPAPRYPTALIVMHWAIAAAVVGLVALGWWMQAIPKQPVASGRCVQPAQVDRLTSRADGGSPRGRIGHPLPELPAMPPWQAPLRPHVTFYVGCSCPLLRLPGFRVSGYPVKFFGVTLPAWAGADDAVKDACSFVHLVSNWVLLGAIGARVTATRSIISGCCATACSGGCGRAASDRATRRRSAQPGSSGQGERASSARLPGALRCRGNFPRARCPARSCRDRP